VAAMGVAVPGRVQEASGRKEEPCWK